MHSQVWKLKQITLKRCACLFFSCPLGDRNRGPDEILCSAQSPGHSSGFSAPSFAAACTFPYLQKLLLVFLTWEACLCVSFPGRSTKHRSGLPKFYSEGCSFRKIQLELSGGSLITAVTHTEREMAKAKVACLKSTALALCWSSWRSNLTLPFLIQKHSFQAQVRSQLLYCAVKCGLGADLQFFCNCYRLLSKMHCTCTASSSQGQGTQKLTSVSGQRAPLRLVWAAARK